MAERSAFGTRFLQPFQKLELRLIHGLIDLNPTLCRKLLRDKLVLSFTSLNTNCLTFQKS